MVALRGERSFDAEPSDLRHRPAERRSMIEEDTCASVHPA
jgi:hypothetical protein